MLKFALFALSSLSSAREVVFPPVAAVHPSGQLPMGHHDTVDITSGSQFSGLTTFARIPYINCFLDEESSKQPYDIAILGAPFDTVRYLACNPRKLELRLTCYRRLLVVPEPGSDPEESVLALVDLVAGVSTPATMFTRAGRNWWIAEMRR